MHDFTLILAIVAVVLLAYQADIDERPAVHQEPWTHPRERSRTVFVMVAVLAIAIVPLILVS